MFSAETNVKYDLLEALLHQCFDQRFQDILLTAEVMIKCSSWDICFPTDVRYGNNLVGLPGHQIQQAGFYLCFLLCSGPLYSKALSKKPRSTNILLMISKANSFISIIQGKRSFINKNKEI